MTNFPMSLSKKEVLDAFERAGYTYDAGDFYGGARLESFTEDGTAIYRVTIQNQENGAWQDAKAYGKIVSNQLHLEF